MSLWCMGHSSIRFASWLMSTGRFWSFPRGPCSRNATMCAASPKLPSVNVRGPQGGTHCTRRTRSGLRRARRGGFDGVR